MVAIKILRCKINIAHIHCWGDFRVPGKAFPWGGTSRKNGISYRILIEIIRVPWIALVLKCGRGAYFELVCELQF